MKRSKGLNIALTVVSVLFIGFSGTLLVKYINNKIKSKKNKNILLLGGLDNRKGDISIKEQVELLKSGASESKSIEGFRYNDIIGLLNKIKESEKEMYVVLFSAGCSKSREVAETLKQKGYNLNYMFIVEPYAKSSTISSSVIDAINIGVPSKNVMVGRSESTGMGIIKNPTFTPNCTPTHLCSLIEVGKIIK